MIIDENIINAENIKTSNDSNDGSMVGNENVINNALENDLRDAINCEIEDKSINETCGNDNIEEDEEEDEEEDNAENDEKLGIELNKQVVEALLFANGEELSLEKLEEALQVPKDQILFWIDELCKKYNSDESSFELVKLNDKYQLRTKDTYSAYIRRLKIQKPRRLSNSALETLAVIAYKQPIMKSEIERIRGVDATPTIKTLISRNLIKIMGHADKIGQPALYATTDDFLKVFNLNSLKDLPNLREIVNITDEPEEMPEEA